MRSDYRNGFSSRWKAGSSKTTIVDLGDNRDQFQLTSFNTILEITLNPHDLL